MSDKWQSFACANSSIKDMEHKIHQILRGYAALDGGIRIISQYAVDQFKIWYDGSDPYKYFHVVVKSDPNHRVIPQNFISALWLNDIIPPLHIINESTYTLGSEVYVWDNINKIITINKLKS